MSNEIFPTLAGLTWDINIQPNFDTKIQTSKSGYETRWRRRLSPLYTIDMGFEFLSGVSVAGQQSELQKIVGLFNRHFGAWDSFLYTRADDSAVTDQPIGQGDGINKQFQLVRTWGMFTEATTNINTVVNIKVNGVIKTPLTDYTVGAGGVITFVTAPAERYNVTASFSYYYRCRFNDDFMDASAMWKDMWEMKSLTLIGTLGKQI